MIAARAGRAGARNRLQELIRYRDLVMNLTLRDLRVKYRRSTLGVAWSLLNPLIMMAIYTVVFSKFLRFVTVPNYWALVLGGILVWGFFAQAVTASSVTYSGNAGLITKVYFPIESLPIATVLANFVSLVISVALLLVALVVARATGIWTPHTSPGPVGASVVLLPVLLAAQLLFTVGFSLLAACLTVFFRDIEHFVGLGLLAWFYVTPIIYPLDPKALPHAAARYLPLFKLNPMTWYLDSYHAILYYGTWPDPLEFVLALLGAGVALAIGYGVFLKLRPRLPEEV